MKKIKLRLRSKPHDPDCYCAKYPVYTKWYVWPTDVLGTPQTKLFKWLFWELLIIH